MAAALYLRALPAIIFELFDGAGNGHRQRTRSQPELAVGLT
jgi:hypothetical protein